MSGKTTCDPKIRGARVYGDRINPDGSTVYNPDDRAELEFPNGGEWQQGVTSPSGSKAAGVLIHYNLSSTVFGSTPTAVIKGFQLICRIIELG